MNGNSLEIIYHPIGYFHCTQKEKYAVPRQSVSAHKLVGSIELLPNLNYEQALADLAGFERIWILFHCHYNQHWKPKVYPPRGGVKRGVFATRSPHRPNAIGMSCVKLTGIKGRILTVEEHDLLEGTPILDIKPYVKYADSFPNTRQGWLEQLPEEKLYEIIWSQKAQQQLEWLQFHLNFNQKTTIELRLSQNPYPYRNNRIRILPNIKNNDKSVYELAIQEWRVIYELPPQMTTITIIEIQSGYLDDATEVPLHHTKYKNYLSFNRE
ncbi:MAG: hypothetical protein K0S74_958 [Chlamydiales bacterium]|jgi:tRNA-Thr(GGU) m(6)t(6)A37 methyltransferase TsaA|nr:hypothetical protein [Chlamydiales bacterium]